jgi:mono/diheme cytochrome c family protein
VEKWKSKLKVQRFAVAAFVCVAALIAAFSTALFSAQLAPLAPTSVHLAPTSSRLAPTGFQLAPTAQPARTLLDTYCVSCHNQRTKTADLALDTLNLADVSAHADVWEEVVRKLRGGLMPPAGVRRPPQADVDAFVRSLEHALDQAALANPNPGRVALHRLNRAEYANAIEDLLGVRVDAAALLPKDDEADGFDNVASVLTVSPSFLEQYISAARVVTNMALGNRAQRAVSMTYRPARGTDQTQRVEGLPLGTRGGLIVDHLFPADGEYKLNINGLAGAGYVRGMEYAHTVVVLIDGVKVFQGRIGGEEDLKAIDQQQAAAVAAINGRFQNIPLTIAAGPHKVGVTFMSRTLAESDDVLGSFKPGALEDRIVRVGSVEILGPFNPSGLSDTPARQRVFVCKPASRPSSQEAEASEVGCASKIFSNLARRAFRRPVTVQDLDAPLAFYKAARQNGDFESAIREALPAILASPKFLYRSERTPADIRAGTTHRISDFELASRLSYFLTGRAPDEQLLAAAEKAGLSQPKVLETHVRRLLATPQANSLVTSFAFQWLKLRALDDADPDAILFPNFDESLREAFKREIELFVESVFRPSTCAQGAPSCVEGREDRSVLDLLTADYTFVNERLALHYGIPDVRGTRFRRVTLGDQNRFGLLGKGSVLTVTSYANRTAPVLRGAWILENLMGTPPAAPPPDVEGFPENKDGEKAKSVREIMELHRAKPSCASCHGIMDPLGFALENFDAIGEWRSADRWAATPIDAAGKLVDGTAVGGPVDLRKALMRRPDQFVQTLTEKLMTYGLGRSVEYYDMPAVRQIVRDASRDNYRFSSIVMGIVKSVPFQMRKAATE